MGFVRNTYTAGEALIPYQRVMLKTATTTTPSEIVVADETNKGSGIVLQYAQPGDLIAVIPYSEINITLIAAEAISKDAELYAAPNGKVGVTNTNAVMSAKAKEAVSNDGDEDGVIFDAVFR